MAKDAPMYKFSVKYLRKEWRASEHTSTPASKRVHSNHTVYSNAPGTLFLRSTPWSIAQAGFSCACGYLLPGCWRYRSPAILPRRGRHRCATIFPRRGRHWCATVRHDYGAITMSDDHRFQTHGPGQYEHGEENN